MTRVEALVARTTSAEETRGLGEAVAALAQAGDIVLLGGDLGAGKTVFSQGFARGLGVTEVVTSPTFTLVRPYEGRLRFLHADVYRLDRLQEIIDLGLVEQLDDQAAVACIEWGDLAKPVLPSDFLEIRLAYDDRDDLTRDVRLAPVGPSWAPRWRALQTALARWAVPAT